MADKAVNLLQKYQDIGAPVGQYLADQLLLPLVVGNGGSFVTGQISEHCRTNIAVIQKLTDVAIKMEELEAKRKWRIIVKK